MRRDRGGGGLPWLLYTVCLRSSDQFYIVSYYIKWVTTSWTYRTTIPSCLPLLHILSFIMLWQQFIQTIYQLQSGANMFSLDTISDLLFARNILRMLSERKVLFLLYMILKNFDKIRLYLRGRGWGLPQLKAIRGLAIPPFPP